MPPLSSVPPLFHGAPVVLGEPIPAPAVEEAMQMLGHDPAMVVSMVVSHAAVDVLVAASHGTTLVHHHPVTPA